MKGERIMANENKIEYTDREINISNAFFEIMQPRMIYFFKQFLEARSLETEIFWKEQMVPSISQDVRDKIMSDVEDMIDKKLDAFKESEIDISEQFETKIQDIIDDYIRYNVSFTTTVE
tara:strand:- start:1610 stop:1966 length:357 start_codon:yes stop_codon:yes gene_type:complete